MGGEKNNKSKLWNIFVSSGLFTGVAIAFVGYITSSSLERWKTNEAHTQLYAELMGKREEAESALRKDMFTSIITSFLKTEKSDRETPLTEEQELTRVKYHSSHQKYKMVV
ncbi:MAG: hypothetical protein A3J73_01535 [Planctomycetes bacterium RIFCSPHIGHO2_02_FULL_38_41]|nr:MAG: hypothetical protein A3J73_01535 [Planctomycetes bacterium RIFCSPHIGHO2_02_FULL_38_41]OHB97264.1 MAG: hypothetical protein A2W74_06825 [Planctomycetes bacterium RIFCSPLOWO2_12_38_17]